MRYLLLAVFFASCSGGGSAGGTTLPPAPIPSSTPSSQKVTHIVILVQENRSVDNLFHFLRGADVRDWGFNGSGNRVPLHPVSLTAQYDISHDHRDGGWVTEYNNGGMNGFDKARVVCKKDPAYCNVPDAAYAYVPQDEVKPYYQIASQYAFADHMFQTNEGPSFPAHQYLVSGTSSVRDGSDLLVAENPDMSDWAGCSGPSRATVRTIDPQGRENVKVRPCFDRKSLMTELDEAGISWKYYQSGGHGGYWKAVDALKPLWQQQNSYHSRVDTNPSDILQDIKNNNLPAVSWVTPTKAASDHALVTDGTGPDWVGTVVNAIGESPYWQNTVILVTWDDWGGWYDHVKPHVRSSYELGFRVPLLAISAHSKAGHISHEQYEFGSILKLVETTFGLPSLGTTDTQANDLRDMFEPTVSHKFVPIVTRHDAEYFLRQPADGAPDD